LDGNIVEWEQYLTPDFVFRFTSRDNMTNPALAPTPVKLINPVVLSCIDDMFYRLPFPNTDDLDRLIKAAGPLAESNMMEFRQGLREELNSQRALDDFATGWVKYWKSTRAQDGPTGSAGVQASLSFQARNRSPSPDKGSGGESGGTGESEGSQR
jgi:hypothetical protein